MLKRKVEKYSGKVAKSWRFAGVIRLEYIYLRTEECHCGTIRSRKDDIVPGNTLKSQNDRNIES